MRGQLKSWLAGFVVGAVLMSGVAYAAGGYTQIQVSFKPLKYYFDGEPKDPPADQTGFIYNGHVYVPLRFIAETIGKDVTWDGKNWAVYVGKVPGGPEPGKWLTDMDPISVDENADYRLASDDDPAIANDDSEFHRAFIYDTRHSLSSEYSFEYVLDGKYSRLDGVLALSKENIRDMDYSWTIYFYGDDNLLSQFTIKKGDTPTPISVDLTGVLRLRIKVHLDGGSILGEKLIFANPRLIESGD